jgi:hypothetical protein
MSVPIRVHKADAIFASVFAPRLKSPMPDFVDAMGDLDLLKKPLTAFFCSAKCPGKAILRTYDLVTGWRDDGRVVVGGSHSPVERDTKRHSANPSEPGSTSQRSTPPIS